MLTQERLKELLSYNPETGVFIWKEKPCRSVLKGAVAGTMRSTGYVWIKVDKGQYAAHRLAWLWAHGELPSSDLDHINADSTDNRIENLRLSTHTQNMQNRHKPWHNSKAQLTGAHWVEANQNWRSSVKTDGKNHHVGTFDCPMKAHIAYLKAKAKIHPGFVLTDEEKTKIAEFDSE